MLNKDAQARGLAPGGIPGPPDTLDPVNTPTPRISMGLMDLWILLVGALLTLGPALLIYSIAAKFLG
jgi:hypothetical protein